MHRDFRSALRCQPFPLSEALSLRRITNLLRQRQPPADGLQAAGVDAARFWQPLSSLA